MTLAGGFGCGFGVYQGSSILAPGPMEKWPKTVQDAALTSLTLFNPRQLPMSHMSHMSHSPQAINRLQRLIWALIYAGLFGLVVGGITRREDNLLGVLLMTAGAVAAAVGVVLIWVRSRVADDAPAPDAIRAGSGR